MSKSTQRENSTGIKRTTDERSRDLADIARLRLEGMGQDEIAAWLEQNRPYQLSQQTVSNDLKAVRDGWMRMSLDSYEKLRQIELSRLDQEESIALQSWTQSKQPRRRREYGSNASGPFEKFVLEEDEHGKIAPRDGNPAFLARLESIRERRCKLLGFDAWQRSENINTAIMTLVEAGYVVRDPTSEQS